MTCTDLSINLSFLCDVFLSKSEPSQNLDLQTAIRLLSLTAIVQMRICQIKRQIFETYEVKEFAFA